MSAEDGSEWKSPIEANLEALLPGAQVSGVSGSGPVTVVTTQWIGTRALTLTYRDVHGRTNQVILDRDREASLSIVSAGDSPRFDADPKSLFLEAVRLSIAPWESIGRRGRAIDMNVGQCHSSTVNRMGMSYPLTKVAAS